MNRVYRLIWSQVLNGWVAVAESGRGRGKAGAARKLVAATLSLFSVFAQAAPVGGQLVSGTASISQSGANTTIQQSSQNLSLNWKSFNVAPQETVNFVQPSASAIAVNRIFDTSGTKILGQLNANGQVYLINPNGILFGQGAQVNVGGLVASTLDLNDATLSGTTKSFSGNGSGSIVNQGTINAAKGGYVALLGNTVSNQGTITAPKGTVALGAGSATTLNFNGNSLVKMQVDQSVLNSLAENGGLIRADGGTVVMNAGAKNALLASVVNNTGVIEARTAENHEGTIILLGGMAAGTVNVGGRLEASAPDGGNGGFIETSASRVKIAETAKVTTAAPQGQAGNWLIDPVDFTIAATGGDITGATLGASLGAGNVIIQSTSGGAGTAGDVNVNDVVAWGANKLTLNAQRNININANLNGSGTASLALEYGFGALTADYVIAQNVQVNLPVGLNFSTKLGSGGTVINYTVITGLGGAGSTTGADLQGMSGDLAGYYALGSNIDAAPTSGWNAGAGFAPVGTLATKFTGMFDGLGHTISNLTINRPATDYVGLFGETSLSSAIRNVGMVGGNVIGKTNVGALVGLNRGPVSNSYATGNVSRGHKNVGGLAGGALGSMSNVWASSNVSNVSGGIGFVGGLVGNSATGGITNAYATGTVSGTGPNVGGLVGFNQVSTISNAYASGNVSGTLFVGGLVGSGAGGVVNSYATGNVSGTGLYVGGLVGYNYPGITINNAYATGSVSGAAPSVGGLVGHNAGTVSNSYWNSSVNATGIGSGTTTGTTGRTSAEMMSMASFTGFNIANTGGSSAVWRIYEGQTTPWLMWWLKPITTTANSDTTTYSGAPYSGGNGVTYSVASPSPAPSGVLAYGGTSQSAVNAGSYTISASGLYSVQQGYDISYATGTLTINKAHLTLTADDKTRLYGATNPALTSTVSGFVNGETASTAAGFTGAGSATTLANATTSVGTAVITAGAGTLAATNYDFSNLVDGTLTINPAMLTPQTGTPPTPAPAPAPAPAPVLNATSQIQSEFTQFNPLDQHPTLVISPTVGGELNAYLQEVVVVGNKETRIDIGGRGPTVQILGGGVRLPGNVANVNEKDKP